jgi:hypothetical protein
MISEADFPHVFPWMRPSLRSPGQERLTGFEPPAPGCIARWEDDGGAILAPRSGHRRPAGRVEISSDPLDATFAVPPALALAVVMLLHAFRTTLPR